jgi:acyl-CoA thioester hydrolase
VLVAAAGNQNCEYVAMPRHRVMTPLRWSDMDAYGHINNVQFLRLLEEARVVAFNFDIAAGQDLPSTGLLVARSEIEYMEPLLYQPDPVAIDLWVTRIGAADFDMAYQVLDRTETGEGSGRVYAQAETTLVAFDLESGRPRRITDVERERLQAWGDDPVRWRRRRRAAVR